MKVTESIKSGLKNNIGSCKFTFNFSCNLFESTKSICGVTKHGPWRRDTWWYINTVESFIKERNNVEL